MSSKYTLSTELHGHEADVRATAALGLASGTSLILSASRDRTARLSARQAGSKDFLLVETLKGHQGFVNACTFLHSGDTAAGPNQAVAGAQIHAVTAGQDKTINAYPVEEHGQTLKVNSSPQHSLQGHTENVCALDVGPIGSYIVSGSWDKTAKVWQDWKCVATLKGHEHAVWAVLAVDSDRIITASADKVIRLWSIASPAKPIATFAGHTDAVRGLTLLEGGQAFASCGNDAVVNVYNLASLSSSSSSPNHPFLTLSGHTSFAYSVSAIANSQGQFASSGEDRSVRIWKGDALGTGEMLQSITLPAVSVWSVSALPDGDLVTGANDGVVRVFTRSSERQASAADVEAFEASVASQELNKAQIGDVKLDQMPGLEALTQPGKKEGDVKMVRNGAIGEAYQWTQGSWQKIGDVVGGVGTGQKQLHKGVEYDFVFDVDVAEGVPPLKLPYNSGENAYFAAQRFIDQNELPQTFLEEIVQFIDKNAGQQSSTPANSGYVDPYTGSNRYTAAGSSAPARQQSSATASSSPWTGADNPDPFTRSASPPSATPAALAILPLKAPLGFKQFNPAPVKAKIGQLAESAGSLSAEQLSNLNKVIDDSAAPARTSPIDATLLEKLLQSWPASSRFPLLDVYRVVAAGPATISPEKLAHIALSASGWSDAWPTDAAAAKQQDTNNMLALRALANLYTRSDVSPQLLDAAPQVIGAVSGSNFAKLSKNGRVAFATLVMNIAVLSYQASNPVSFAGDLLQLIVEILSSEEGDSEVIYRTMMGVGTLLKSKTAGALPVDSVGLAKDLSSNWAQRLTAEVRITQLEKELAAV